MERINKGYLLVGLVVASVLFFELAAHADEWNQATEITFSEPVQIPGETLPAGTYLFRLADSGADRNVVQIFNSDGTVLCATVQTIPTDRLEPTGDTTITLAEQESGNPDALLKWFYPGRLTGNEFVYSKEKEKELAQDKQQTIAANQQSAPSSAAAEAGR